MGSSIVGYGLRHLKYDSGREMDWMVMVLAVAKAISRFMSVSETYRRYDEMLKRLGKHKTGKGCLYIDKLVNIDEAVLKELISASFKNNKD